MKCFLNLLLILAINIQWIFPQTDKTISNWRYPSLKADTAINYYFGKKVIDPFRNLEDLENEKVKTWMKGQNVLYDTIIHSITNCDSLESEIRKMQKIKNKWVDVPRIAGNRIFYTFGYYNDSSDIVRLGYSEDINREPFELFNTKEFNERDSCVYYINYFEPSRDGHYIAFGISPNGSEKASILIIDAVKKELLPEKIDYSLGGNIQWLPDGTGFFYMRDKDIITEEDKNTFYEDARVMLHKLYNNPKNDREVFSRLLNKDLGLEKISWPRLFVFPSSDKVLINIVKDSYYVIYYQQLKDLLAKPAETIVWTKICGVKDKMGSNVMYNDRFFGISYRNNPNGQLISMKLPDTTRTVVCEASGFALDDLILTHNTLYVTTIEKGLNKLVKVNPENFVTLNIPLPFLGGISLVPFFSIASSYQASDYLFFTLERYDKPMGGYICDENNKVTRTNIFPEYQYLDPPLDLIEEEIEVPSYDGIMVPLSIVYKKGIKFDGTNPAIIEAYGAFGISMKPIFFRNRLIWFNHGGIYAVAHVRGGFENGNDWHKGGLKATKPNSWKDLIACAEYMVKNKYTSSQKLATVGYSAGGITIGRAITERPDLFKAAVIYSGVCNTIRQENTFNPQVSEFGTVKDSLESQYLFEMDTYHHIRQGIYYPSVLFTAGLNDSRVPPWQPAKAVARMQEVSNRENIILFRIEDQGHFSYPSDAEVYSFLFWQLGKPDFQLESYLTIKK